jgi:hypothetical protein
VIDFAYVALDCEANALRKRVAELEERIFQLEAGLREAADRLGEFEHYHSESAALSVLAGTPVPM